MIYTATDLVFAMLMSFLVGCIFCTFIVSVSIKIAKKRSKKKSKPLSKEELEKLKLQKLARDDHWDPY